MDTNRHECQWTCLAATPSREEGRERGRPARTTLAQPRPSFPLGSTGNGVTIPRFRFGRADGVPGGRVAKRRITGKLSGHPTQRMRARRPRSRRGASSDPSCSARRHCPCRCGRVVPLRVPSSSFGRVEDWRVDCRVRWLFRRFRFGPQSGSLITFPVPALRTGRAVFPHPALQWDHASRTRVPGRFRGRRLWDWHPSPTPSTSAPGLPPGLLTP